MKNKSTAPGPAGADVSQRIELTNRAVLGTIRDAWSRYPSAVASLTASENDSGLLTQVLDLLVQEGVVRMAGNSVALTESGYKAVELAGRRDQRLSELLQGRSLPAEAPRSSSLVLAILRAHFELRSAPNRLSTPEA